MTPAIPNGTIRYLSPSGVGVPASPHVVAVAERTPGIVLKSIDLFNILMPKLRCNRVDFWRKGCKMGCKSDFRVEKLRFLSKNAM